MALWMSGFTCTAHVRAELSGDTKTTDFQGQAIWRYQPETHRFEIFAEGGGNTFGLEFDDAGRAYSGTNWGKYRGLHFVQGGYYLKSWGKHGPLTNPYAFGYFDHMPHTGNADRLSHTFIVYGGGLLGNEYTGKIISPNPLQSRIQVTRLEPLGSSYKTIEEPFMVTCDDGWFRPVDLKAGPDGALYVADFYECRISHVDPRDTWDRSTGRIFRVRPADWKPGLKRFDLGTASGAELVQKLASSNRWERTMAREMLALHPDPSVIPMLRKMLLVNGQPALEALWALKAVGGLTSEAYGIAMQNAYAPVRMWAARLQGDTRGKPIETIDYLLDLEKKETDPQVRSQLASTAKRLVASQALPLIQHMLTRDEDANDVHIPLLLWWAVEDKAASHPQETVEELTKPDLWQHPLAQNVVLPRLARRYAADPTADNQIALAKLLQRAPADADRHVLLEGVKEGFWGFPCSNWCHRFASSSANRQMRRSHYGSASPTRWMRHGPGEKRIGRCAAARSNDRHPCPNRKSISSFRPPGGGIGLQISGRAQGRRFGARSIRRSEDRSEARRDLSNIARWLRASRGDPVHTSRSTGMDRRIAEVDRRRSDSTGGIGHHPN